MTLASLAALALGLGFFSESSAAPDRTEASAPITVSGAGPYHQLTLPAALYSHAAHADLRDLRIRNAQGDAVPYAWLREEPSPRTLSQAVPIFPVPGHEPGAADALPAFRIGADGALRLIEPIRPTPSAPAASAAWLIDVSQVSGQLLQARFELASQSEGVFGLTLQASDDLRHWRAVGGEQQLVRLRHEERTLEQLHIDLGGIRARFLRLRWRDPAQGAALAVVHIDSQQAVELKPQQEWSGALAPTHCSSDACDYLAPRGWPLQSLRIELAQANTLAQVQISGLLDAPPATTPAPQPPRLLPALRHPHRREPPSSTAPGPQEIVLADTLLYRLSRDDQEVRSPALTLDGAVYPRLRLHTQGPISQLGSVPPTLELGITPRTLVFLAQGQPPFRLAWQSAVPDKAAPVLPAGAAMALATLMPGGAASQALTAGTAQVTLPGAVALTPPASAPASATASRNPYALPARNIWLWAALGTGLLLLAGMAWSLFASLKKSAPSKSDT